MCKFNDAEEKAMREALNQPRPGGLRIHKDGTDEPIRVKKIRHRDVAAGRPHQVFTVVDESHSYYIVRTTESGWLGETLQAYPKSHWVEVPQKRWVDVTSQCKLFAGEIMHGDHPILKHPSYRVEMKVVTSNGLPIHAFTVECLKDC